LLEPVRYALVVILEVGEGIDIPIYEEIKFKVQQPIQVIVKDEAG